MELSSILNPNAVKVVTEASSKKRLFQRLAEIAQSAYGIEGNRAVDALLERESLGPTGVGQGIALPHARLDDIDHVAGVFFRLDRAVEYDAVDKLPVDLVFALFAPRDAGVDHLKALAMIARTMRNADICEKLRANDDPTTLHTILTEAPNSQAA